MTTRNSTIFSVIIRSIPICGVIALGAGCVSEGPTRLHSRVGIDRNQDNTPNLAAIAATAGDPSQSSFQGQGMVGAGVPNATGAVVAPGSSTANGALNVGATTATGVGVNAPPGIAQVTPGSATSSGASIGTGISGTGTGAGSSAIGTATSAPSIGSTGTRTSGATIGGASTSVGSATLAPSLSGSSAGSTSLTAPNSSTIGSTNSILSPGLGASSTIGTSSFLTQTNQSLFSTNLFGPH